ncbi:hypothetical protein Pla22_29000 [Rubripirellula amarantea]|uniref:Uncharacterized protein n=1 Tax=Rubripirellula amarantea TaxID=2527999 RepID=A0A5C5WHL8_9BACT|nr:hypothetical protein Pla22_29000 [Rubripirellula amarantea]
MSPCRTTVVGQHAEHGIKRTAAGSDLVSIDAIDQGGLTASIADQVVAQIIDRASGRKVGVPTAAIASDDGVADVECACAGNADRSHVSMGVASHRDVLQRRRSVSDKNG